MYRIEQNIRLMIFRRSITVRFKRHTKHIATLWDNCVTSIQVMCTKVVLIRSANYFQNYWALTMVYYSLTQSPFLVSVYGLNLKTRRFGRRLPKRRVFNVDDRQNKKRRLCHCVKYFVGKLSYHLSGNLC
jgi:hypothetical protein